MKVTSVRVEVSKTVSDGSYGNERYNVQYQADIDDTESPDLAIDSLLNRGMHLILGKLGLSSSGWIRAATKGDPEDEEDPY